MNQSQQPVGESSREARIELFCRAHGLEDLDRKRLDQALTHRSYAYEAGLEKDNERLEFLGDACIGLVTSEYLYREDRQANEGDLSKWRAQLVSRRVLGMRAAQMELGELLLLGRGERETGGATRLSTLGSALEAVAGAVYCELGFERMRTFVIEHLIEFLWQEGSSRELQADFKSRLQEWTQREAHEVPEYRRTGESGPDHCKKFMVEVSICGQLLATGEGSRVKSAENHAARQALAKLESGQIVLARAENERPGK